ncbi:helix-turn-helix domain-containing protein [Phytomonospora endophytica]|uniref:DNA-binding transcriptional ArsR family regulator n=1 Tax=Phytomonospora endophytica TaxID=714109 RepID=A0A841FYB3_9ACTN|nr:helix-turn-helix domain-containing protein [Phytomonospora endophytica]MBB6038502.1 DNA-binding transcriptional ArsR family regulator [Phytomonospora endophytica]
MDVVDLLLHPVRIRVVHAFAGGRELTTAELGDQLPDVAKTTLYRHVGMLAGAGILEVVGEERVHGAVERTYRLDRSRTRISPEDAAAMSLDDHRHGFAAAMGALLADFSAYLDRPDADPTADSVGYVQVPIWLSKEEIARMVERLREVVVESAANEPADGRRLYLVSPILFPIDKGS